MLAGTWDETILLRVSTFRAVERRSSGTSALYCTLPLLSTQRKISPALAGFLVAVVAVDALMLGVGFAVVMVCANAALWQTSAAETSQRKLLSMLWHQKIFADLCAQSVDAIQKLREVSMQAGG